MADATHTEKGAVSLPTTQPLDASERVGGRLNLFFKAVRGLGETDLHRLLAEAWTESPLDTLRIVCQTRDCRGGKGERLLFRQMMQWVARQDPASVACNMHLIPLYGRWDDVLFVPGGVDFMARQLQKDQKALKERPDANITLAAKWAPTERHALDKKHKLVARLVQALFPEAPATATSSRTLYRKMYLSPLRAHLNVVERVMCAREWDTIDYSHVPSRAMKNYRHAFERHDEVRFGEWKTALARDDKTTDDGRVVKVNADQVFPHELVKVYLNQTSPDTVVEEQWKALQAKLAQLGTLDRSVCVCDVSSSMDGEPMLVSIALGLLISSVTAEPFRNQIITFETTPRFHHVQGDTLAARVACLKGAPWGGTTNLQAVFDRILERAKRFRVADRDMPKRLYIFSDMQFDVACGENTHTNFEALDAKFRQAGYTRPQIVFWNLRGNTPDEFPVTANEHGVSMLSGFSTSLLKSLLDGADLTPWGVLRKILDQPRYSAITHATSGEVRDEDLASVARDLETVSTDVGPPTPTTSAALPVPCGLGRGRGRGNSRGGRLRGGKRGQQRMKRKQ